MKKKWTNFLSILVICIAMVFFFTSCTIQSAIEQKKSVEELLGKIGESEDKINSRGQPATMKENEVEDYALKDVYKDYFLVGAAINGYSVETAAINHPGMVAILEKHFNSTTLSNLMKPQYLLDYEATKASKDGMPVCKFDSCIPALQFCKEYGIKMRGHVLVWHNQTPEWFFHKDYDVSKPLVDAATMERRLESYIKQVIEFCQKNYPGVVYCWDVVNEAILDDGSWRETNNNWYTIMKEKYVEKAFYYARKYAKKDVALFYNDYNVFLPAKREAIYNLAQKLKEKGLIDGLGLQPTVGLNYPELDSDDIDSFKTTLETFAKLGLQIHITELNFEIKGDESNRTPENLKKQADRYYEMMKLLLKEDTDNGGLCNITCVTVFGICDDYPLYKNFKQCMYLWDKNCNPKPCFYSFLQAGLDWKASLLSK
ncbi:endo-1,4-beta-xylanase [Anaerocellum diazotrophicum]|uniref:Beta-xylanase n=1 Tax=Caldicellulosiruptor diazotrophicus TaxID=2806205 RepID=A0ABM7NQ51_9FIRM|nr:endo-1,4-beta-xylanase [Caldicellulosiruptor diazotrophicus]BCS82260.1 hypothetical protein CaldiYA01_22200 [Caldicellulosiruptor diazotrophicus]